MVRKRFIVVALPFSLPGRHSDPTMRTWALPDATAIPLPQNLPLAVSLAPD
jgi:hypothetical protein